MALSQIQCLDDHHVNWRVSESKPEFFYSEDQRLALEALLTKGRDGFSDYIRQHAIRDFLSDLEIERLARTAEAYRPGHEREQKPEATGGGNTAPGSGEEGVDVAVSLQYWPDRSEASVAELDMGWPDAISYRGITRVTVHTQPPSEGQTHIKEVVRKTIASAQKVIAVVMDEFTDVDIFRDLLDASYKRKVPVYIIIDMAAVPCFLSMCGRADMHHGHLKNLRVRCCGGVEFYTRSAQKVHGSLRQRFLLIDGDRAISGSYNFTWSSSRLDRNLVTVVTGQAVENFDTQFRDLFLTSRGVSLAKVPLTDEPTPDPLPQAVPAPVSASVARKLINPKYALVATGNHASPASSDQNSSNKNPTGLRMIKGRIKEPVEVPPLHPGLANLEKIYLIPYLPTWPEPDPPSDVIGFINIRDDKRANKVHLQRSERFEVSQAIRFSSPFTPAPAPTNTHSAAVGKDTDTDQDTDRDTDQDTDRDTDQDTDRDTDRDKDTDRATRPSESKATDTSAPPTQSSTQPTEQKHTGPSAHHSSEPSQKPDTPQELHTHAPEQNTTIPKANDVTVLQQPADASDPPPAAGAADPPQAPPTPKPRTLHLVVDRPHSEQTGQPQVSLVKKSQSAALQGSSDKVQTLGAVECGHSQSEEEEEVKEEEEEEEEDVKDSGSNGSQDSTKVICDRAANGNPSSISTASDDEFYDCNQTQSGEAVANGITTGSGRGHRQGDGVNVMARLSQSMLDLRGPSQSEDSADLIHQSQQLRRQAHASPHRHIGQLFQTSSSPVGERQMRGAKVVIAKPGSYHRPTRASGPVIGGHRYWSGQTDPGLLRPEMRSGRSPRRHSPAHRNTGHASPPANLAGVLGLSFSKLNNLRHLRSRGGGSQKKTSQNYKDAI